MKAVRCAIYTRKSSEEGLEQAFNSLDAQREACAAYVLSQASEGWSALPDIYDDGGLSGGSLERPALQRLLADVAAGRIDIIVVYKVDRLTRSLLDFAKLVEAFDKAGTSFVSVTQSFNTTTSMGRLTLNMLLSFAQFEREVTAERIRDKISASKAKGMWMGGTPPLGYRPDARSLAIVEEHAAIVRHIFRRYLELGNVRLVAGALANEGICAPTRHTSGGKPFGGCAFTRGQLYAILKNPVYAGDIRHQGKLHKGLHSAIIDRDGWGRVQAKLADHLQGQRRTALAAKPTLLARLIIDEAGEPLVATHACKGKVRYRYYVSRGLQHGGAVEDATAIRMPAREIEAAVTARVAEALHDPLALAAQAWLLIAPGEMSQVLARSAAAAAAVANRERDVVRTLVHQVRLLRGRIEIDVATRALGDLLQVPIASEAPAAVTLTSEVRLTRTGRAVRLIQSNGTGIGDARPDPTLVKLVAKARSWWSEVRAGEVDVPTLARREGVTGSYVARIIRLTFLSPNVVEAILAGSQRAAVNGGTLTAPDAIPMSWVEQQAIFHSGHSAGGL
jgi:DNA invertase Pin-like site-specific DNA recombinase